MSCGRCGVTVRSCSVCLCMCMMCPCMHHGGCVIGVLVSIVADRDAAVAGHAVADGREPTTSTGGSNERLHPVEHGNNGVDCCIGVIVASVTGTAVDPALTCRTVCAGAPRLVRWTSCGWRHRKQMARCSAPSAARRTWTPCLYPAATSCVGTAPEAPWQRTLADTRCVLLTACVWSGRARFISRRAPRRAA